MVVRTRQNLEAEAPALGARVPVHLALGAAVLDQGVLALDDLEVVGRPDAELHRGAGLLPAGAAVAPNGQGGVARHLSLEVPAHARPLARRRHSSSSICSAFRNAKYLEQSLAAGMLACLLAS